MWETLLGSLLGGVFRIVPEIIKHLDAKNERKHELELQQKALEFQKLKGDQRVEEISAQGQQDWNTGALDTLKTAIGSQGKQTGIRWIDGVSATVRPVITYWFMALYCAAKIAIFISAVNAGQIWHEAVKASWTPDDMAIWAGIINFWFLSRVFEKVK